MDNISEHAQVVAFGELLIDFTQTQVDTDGYPSLAAHPGGAPANFLCTLAKLGAKTAMLGKVGDDGFGGMLINTLCRHGVDTRGIIRDKSVFTTLAFVTVDANGNRAFSFARKPGADTCISFDELDLSLIDNAKVFHFGSLSLTSEPSRTATYKAVSYAKQQGKLISYDPNLRKPLWDSLDEAKTQILWGLEQADVVKLSDEEAEFLFGLAPSECAEHIIAHYGAKLVFVTCGANGCYYRSRNHAGFVPSMQGISVADTTGAGDIFAGSAVYKLLQIESDIDELTDAEINSAVRFACVNAGLSTAKYGGISSIPDREELYKELEKV